MEAPAPKPEYQHFIPQFLLRNFSHKYAPNKSKAGKPKKRDRKKMYRGDPVLNTLCLSDAFFLDECLVKRACGLENMYVDTAKALEHQGHLEKKFAVFENKASCVYRKIIKAYQGGKLAVMLERTEKDVLRKFMFLLTYRGEQYHRKYNLDSMQDYDESDKELLQMYMAKHGFTKPIEVWLQSLEAIIDVDIDPKGCWKQRIGESIYFPIANWFISHVCDMYMAICTPANDDEEFVLTDNCYNVNEGQTTAYYDKTSGKHVSLCPNFHKFAPISPRLMIVLRSNLLPEPLEDADPDIKQWRQMQRQLWIDFQYGSRTRSILEDLPVRKAMKDYMEIVNGRLAPKSGWNRRLDINDNFCFTIFQIPTRHVRAINGLLIDHAFHGSRIIFGRKDVFLDLIEWYLTEPCEVGKNVQGENTAKQLRYLEGLSDFMLHEGREITAKMKFWPSEDADLKQFQLQNIAGARFLEQVRHGKDSIELGFHAVYEKLGGTVATYDEDMAMAITMFRTWIRRVDLDWDSPEYESIRGKRLACLLDGYQQQSCCRFWIFLKRMRLAQTMAGVAFGIELIEDIESFDEQAYRGAEDMLAYARQLTQGHELNLAMYKSFNEGMTLIRGAGRGLETMGLFSLFGDKSWRVPTPFSHRDQPCENAGIKDGSDVDETLNSLLLDCLNGKAPTQSPHRNRRFNDDEMKEKAGVKKATHSSLIDTDNKEVPTGPIELDASSIILFFTCIGIALALLGPCIYLLGLLAHSLNHFFEWLLDSLAWLLGIPPPSSYTMGQFLKWLIDSLGLSIEYL